ncbi:uncharacterized protein LOC117119704 [Anneissia japonica]|uniref:uncharacterized protein LOC117119704 n=1 Tax=Anneissia japonica TaxID=1529436 RepID=UPI001425AF60|nr:uncharacterized protein LOC117119704 [Anneissia japonica]
MTTNRYKDKVGVETVFADLRRAGPKLEEVVGVQSLSDGSFDVSFKTPVICRRAAGELGRLVSGPEVQINDSRVTVTVLYVELEVPNEVVECVLSKFGKVLNSRMLSHRQYPSILNGNRQFVLQLKSDIPSQLRIGSRNCWVSYWGQPRTCLRCGDEGHLIRECVRRKCSKCLELGHVVADCKNDIVRLFLSKSATIDQQPGICILRWKKLMCDKVPEAGTARPGVALQLGG